MKNRSLVYLKNTYQLIDQYFDMEEIRTFCFELHIDYDSLRGEGKSAKVRELILVLSRQARLPDLIALAREKRPNITWPMVPQGFELPDSFEWPTANQSPHTVIQGDLVGGDKIGGNKISVGNISNVQGIASSANDPANTAAQQEVVGDDFSVLFTPLLEHIALNTPAKHRVAALKKVSFLEKELEKRANVADETVANLIEDIVALVPTAIDPIVVLFADSAIVNNVGNVTKYVLKRIEKMCGI
ncbi:MAG: hypothetical protein CL608_16165 [Anaerolineaceae bacterium]|nr:hypothetical protein [Anaerolineaceae bacterium]